MFGRRLKVLALAVLCVASLLASSVSAAVLGIDLGTEWFTVALAKPGRPLDLVLNRDAKRQTAAVVVVNGLERTFGADAVALAARMPETTFAGVRNLLGVDYDSELAAGYRQQFPNQMVRGEAGTVAFEAGNTTLTAVELVAMQLQHARQLAKESEGVDVKDVVLAVPAFFDRRQRQALLDASELAGLRTVALVSDGAASALNYAMGRTFDRPERHVLYDMGAGKTVATVAAFGTRRGSKALGVNALAYAADSTLGGQQVDFAVRDLLVEKFAAGDSAQQEAVRGSARAMTRLLREAKRVKTVLTVNVEATAAVEGLLRGVDMRTTVTRAELEHAVTHLAPRIRAPVDRALAAANLTIDDIASIVLVGGGTRAPFVQRALEDAFGARLSRSLNADEACVMGAVFRGASLSSHFRVRDIRLRDTLPYAVQASYSSEAGPQQTVVVSPDFGAVGARRSVRDVRTTDFDVTFEARSSGSGAEWTALATAKVTGVADAAAKLKGTPVPDAKPEVRVVVRTTDVGAFEVVKAEAQFNVTNPAYAQYIETHSDSAESQDQPPAEVLLEAVALAVDVQYDNAARISEEELDQARSLLKRMDADDAARTARSSAINQLESMLYHLRDISETDEVIAVTTDAERDSLQQALDGVSEWLEDNAEHATTEAIHHEISQLKQFESKISMRLHEQSERPGRLQALRSVIAQAENFTANSVQFSAALAPALETLKGTLDSTVAWLESAVAQQDALSPADDPVLLVDDIDARAQAVEYDLAKLIAESIKQMQAAETSDAAESETEPEFASEPASTSEPALTSEPEQGHSAKSEAGHDEL
ncbi:lumenal Hsp70 protein [Coemansia sp. RSA 1821]|nr:lumenal Hsp70 protein [Coemansia sp. RSA 1821]